MKYLLVRSPEGYIDFEPVEHREWMKWLMNNHYTIVGSAESDLLRRELELGIVRSFAERNILK